MFSPSNFSDLQPWVRLWLPESQWSVQHGIDDDFLSGFGQLVGAEHIINGSIPGIGTLQNFAPIPFLFLLGRPGSGKSQELSLAEKHGWLGTHCRRIEGKEFGADVAASLDRLVHDLPRPLRLIIDGLDEALLDHSNFVSQLKGWLRNNLADDGTPMVHLAMSCRWADWPASSINELAALWPKDQTKCLMLCPLRRNDVVETLQHRFSTDAQHFWNQVYDHHLSQVACWPQGLLGLMEQFEESGGKSICAGYSQAIQDQVALYCRLADAPDDSGRWTASKAGIDWRKRVAGRVAAAMIWSAKSKLNLSDMGAAIDSLTVSDFQHSEEPWESSRKLTRLEDLDDLVHKSRLLRRLTDKTRWVFQSQVHQECLAAEWLAAQHLDEPRLRQLFFIEHEAQLRVHPALGAVAAWLASMSTSFRQLLLRHDPLVLLRMDGSSIAESERESIIDAFLEATERIRVVDPAIRQAHLASLNHPQLHAQLEHWLRSAAACDASKELAIEVAEKTHIQSLTSVLWEIFPLAGKRLQIDMAGALHRLATAPQHDLQWQAVLRGEVPSDKNGTLLGAAIESQVETGKVPVRSVLRWMIPGRHFEVYGSFDMAIRRLPEKLTLEDIPEVFSKLGKRPERVPDPLESRSWLHKAAVKLAVTHFDQPKIARALCGYWYRCLSKHVHPHHDYNQTWRAEELGIRDEAHRRAIVRALINHPGFARNTERKYLRGSEYLVTDDDFDWSLDELSIAAPDDQWRWALVLTNSVYRIDISGERGDRLQRAWKELPTIHPFLPAPAAGETLPQTISRLRSEGQTKHEAETARWDKKHQKQKSKFQADLAAYTEDCKQAHERGELVWGDVVQILSGRTHGPGPSTVTFEPISSIGPEDDWMIDSAIRHLRDLPSVRSIDLSDGLGCLLALAACLPRVESSGELRSAIASHWLPALLSDFSMSYLGDVPDGISWERFADWFPEQLPVACEIVIRDRYSKGGQLSELKCFRKCWSPHASERLAAILKDEQIQPSGFFNAMRFLADESESLATLVARKWLAKDQIELSCDQHVVLISVGLFVLNGRLVTEICEGHYVDDADMAKNIISRAMHSLWYRDDDIDFAKWRDEAICDVAQICWRAYPKMDRHIPGGFRMRKVTDEDKAIDFRDRITNEATQRGLHLDLPTTSEHDSPEEAQQRLHRLDWLRNEASKARLQTRRELLSPKGLFELCASPNARLARDADELTSAVIESLRRWEKSIVAGNWQRLWDLKPPRSRDEEDIANELRDWLEKDLKVVAEREVELRSMNRTDVLIQTLTCTGEKLTSLIELKKVRKNNAKERRISMQTQLRDTYLRERLSEGWTHGLYVIAWTPEPGDRLDSETAMQEERSRLAEQAVKLSERPFVLHSLVIDARSKRAVRKPRAAVKRSSKEQER